MNHCKQVPIDEVKTYDCEYCEEALKQAKAQGLTRLWMNQDDHVALDPSKLEDREATNRKYGL